MQFQRKYSYLKNNAWTTSHLSFVPFHPNIRLTEILPKRPREYRKENVVERSCVNSIFARFDIQLDTSFKPSLFARDLLHRMALSSRVRFHRGRDARFEERLNRRRNRGCWDGNFFPYRLAISRNYVLTGVNPRGKKREFAKRNWPGQRFPSGRGQSDEIGER